MTDFKCILSIIAGHGTDASNEAVDAFQQCNSHSLSSQSVSDRSWRRRDFDATSCLPRIDIAGCALFIPLVIHEEVAAERPTSPVDTSLHGFHNTEGTYTCHVCFYRTVYVPYLLATWSLRCFWTVFGFLVFGKFKAHLPFRTLILW